MSQQRQEVRLHERLQGPRGGDTSRHPAQRALKTLSLSSREPSPKPSLRCFENTDQVSRETGDVLCARLQVPTGI